MLEKHQGCKSVGESMNDHQVQDCADRLRMLGADVGKSTEARLGYVPRAMACERCVYGTGWHEEWCEVGKQMGDGWDEARRSRILELQRQYNPLFANRKS